MNENKIKCVVFFGVIFFMLIYFYSVFSKPQNDDEYNYTDTNVANFGDNYFVKSDIVQKTQECLIDIFGKWKYITQWVDIAAVSNNCSKDLINYIPYIDATPSIIEHKFYMIPRLSYINDSCSVVTFGIGGDIDAERHIKMVLPKCTFLGFDPNGKYKTLFEKNLGGKFVREGVKGGKNEYDTILQLNSDKEFKKVKAKNLKSAAKLIEIHHGKSRIIDILNVDIEGFEYSILEDMITNKIYQNVCQINFEIHPVWVNYIGYSFFDVIKLFINIAKNGTFVWVKTTSNRDTMFCIYFINVKNEKCIEKYLKERLL